MDVSDLLASATPRATNARPTIVYQGHTSALRGLHFLPDIIERCAALEPQPRFVVQIQSRETATAQLGPTLQRLDHLAAANGNNVRLVNGSLAAADYYALLQEADLVLLPYAPTFYGHGSSGVFTESASLGKVIVVSPDTVPARQGRDYALGVVTAVKWSASAMADAVALALRDLPALQKKAAAGAPRFRHDQCARVLWDKLLAAVPPATISRAA
jgi:glycosyltransferase involved in cell wall biosynthesis